MPAGVHLRFETAATHITVHHAARENNPVAAPAQVPAFIVRSEDERVGATVADPASSTATLTSGDRARSRRPYSLYLPEALLSLVRSLESDALFAATDSPFWISYGDSITQG